MGNELQLFDSLFRDVFQTPVSMFEDAFRTRDSMPIDIYIHPDTKDMAIRLALAGFSKDEINISTQGDYLKVDASKSEENRVPEKLKDYQEKLHTIRTSRVIKRFYVPSSKYDKENVEAEFEDGVLSLFIKANESEAKKEITIN